MTLRPERSAVSDEHSARDQARHLLDRARRAAPAKPRRPRRPPPDEQPWSGAGPDDPDPAMIGAAVGDLVRDRLWEKSLLFAGILTRWEHIVGGEIAAHCRPVRLEAGRLSCVAES